MTCFGGLAQLSLHFGEAIEYLWGYIECHHCDEDNVHEVDHALSIGISPSAHCHRVAELLSEGRLGGLVAVQGTHIYRHGL